jgi:hypothetical protein
LVPFDESGISKIKFFSDVRFNKINSLLKNISGVSISINFFHHSNQILIIEQFFLKKKYLGNRGIQKQHYRTDR